MVEGVYDLLCRAFRPKGLINRSSVPTMVSDLTESSLVGHPLDALIFGGASAPSALPSKARRSFPTAIMYVDAQTSVHLTY